MTVAEGGVMGRGGGHVEGPATGSGEEGQGVAQQVLESQRVFFTRRGVGLEPEEPMEGWGSVDFGMLESG